jgi:hypothetical protein
VRKIAPGDQYSAITRTRTRAKTQAKNPEETALYNRKFIKNLYSIFGDSVFSVGESVWYINYPLYSLVSLYSSFSGNKYMVMESISGRLQGATSSSSGAVLAM